MAIDNHARKQQISSDVFPITAKFNAEGKLRFAQIEELEGKQNGGGTYIYTARRINSGSSHYYSLSMSADDVFEECVAARKEGRFADLTKLETPRGP